MKIFYLSTSEIPSKTANSVHVMKMCQAFASEGNDVTLFGIKKTCESNIFNYYGVKEIFKLESYDKINIRGLGSFANAIKTFIYIKKNLNVDLLYGRDIYSLFLSRNVGVNIAYEAHSLPATIYHKYLEQKLFKSRKFKKLIVISEALKEAYINEYSFLKKDEIIVAPDGADLPDNIDKECSELKSKEYRANVGYIGHLYKGRGIDVIIELAYKFEDVKFHIIGGMEKDLIYWKHKCKNLNNILFYGFIQNGNLKNYYQKFDIVLAPYQRTVQVAGDRGDTSKWMSPMKIFEYMSYRKAIISSDLPVLREVLVHEENSLLCIPDDIESWDIALRRLINDNFLRVKLGDRAYQDLCEKYTWNIRVKNILEEI